MLDFGVLSWIRTSGDVVWGMMTAVSDDLESLYRELAPDRRLVGVQPNPHLDVTDPCRSWIGAGVEWFARWRSLGLAPAEPTQVAQQVIDALLAGYRGDCGEGGRAAATMVSDAVIEIETRGGCDDSGAGALFRLMLTPTGNGAAIESATSIALCSRGVTLLDDSTGPDLVCV